MDHPLPKIKPDVFDLLAIFEQLGYVPIWCPHCGRLIAKPMEN